jgi:endonuclease-8
MLAIECRPERIAKRLETRYLDRKADSRDEALKIIDEVRPPMFESVQNGFPKSETLAVYKRAGTPCERCGTKIKARGQGDDNRTTYWCPGCQA